VNRHRLIRLLVHVGVDDKEVEAIRKMYEDKMKFTLGNVNTGWLDNSIYPEELIVRVRKSGKGVRIGDRKLGCLAYADDVVLLAENRKEERTVLIKII